MDNDNITDHLIKISSEIGAIGSKIDSLNDTLTKHIEDDKESFKDVYERAAASNARIGKLEDNHKKVRWVGVGMSVILIGLWRLTELLWGSK